MNFVYPSRSKVCESVKSDCIVGLDLVVVALVGEGEWEHALLLQVRLVDAGERLDDDGRAAQESKKTPLNMYVIGDDGYRRGKEQKQTI